jgi:hypothetical protein
MNRLQRKHRPNDHSRENIAIGFIVGMLLGGLIDLYSGDFGIGTILGMILGALIGYRGFKGIHLMEYPPEVIRNLVISGVLFFVVWLSSIYVITHEIGIRFHTILAFATSISGFLFIVSIGNAISKLDELQRRIQIEAIAIGFGITALVTIAFGLLGLTGTPQPNWMYMTVIMAFSWLLGKLWTRWKYR